MSLPRVYGAISAITAAFASNGLPKQRINLDDGYAYRAIDELVERLAPLLGEHKLCILPRVLERTQGERIDPAGESLVHVVLRVAFDLVSVEDGSSHTIEAVGEALDHSDKASAKAMTSAYKHAVLHAFCVPVSGREDADRGSPGRNSCAALPSPVEGWLQWAEDIASVVTACATPEAIERLLASNRAQLSALAREQPDAYTRVGRSIAAQRKVLAQAVAGMNPPVVKPVAGSKRRSTTAGAGPGVAGRSEPTGTTAPRPPRRARAVASQDASATAVTAAAGAIRAAKAARAEQAAAPILDHGVLAQWLACTSLPGSHASGAPTPRARVPRTVPGCASTAVRSPAASLVRSSAPMSAQVPTAAARSSRPTAGPSACVAPTTPSSTTSASLRSRSATHSTLLR